MKDLEKLEEDKRRTTVQLEKEIKEKDALHKEKMKEVEEERDLKCSNLIAKNKKNLEDMEMSYREEIKSIQEKLEYQQNEVIRKLEVEKKELSDEKLKEINGLEERLKQYESEVSRLNDAIKDENSKNATSSDELVSRQRQLQELQNELDRTRTQLKYSEAKVSNLEVDYPVLWLF